ncbi:MAG: hypothetical protein AAGF96_01205 [Bacteroidota bacterium]
MYRKAIIAVVLLRCFLTPGLWGQSSVCPSLDIYDILQDAEVQKALDEAWVDSEEGSPNEHEEGGWITHEYLEDGDATPCREYVTKIYRWNSGTTDTGVPTPRPRGRNLRVVAEFHTHPGPVNDLQYTNHVPSRSDLERSAALKIPGIIRYGRGPTSAQTYDIIYDGSQMQSYDIRSLVRGLNTGEAGFYDTRIASQSQLENADYKAREPEWECEEITPLPEGEEVFREAFEKSTGIPRNPLDHKERPLQFDYELRAEILSPADLSIRVYVNSADGSVGVFEDDIAPLLPMLGEMGPTDDFRVQHIVLGTTAGGHSKAGIYGESTEVFEGASPLVGVSVMTPAPPVGDCVFGRLRKTERYTRYKGEQVPWYRMTVTEDEETVDVWMAMQPTVNVAQAADFRSLVGIIKDPIGGQNYLVTEYKAEALHIKLKDLQQLRSYKRMDLADYTVMTELNTATQRQRFDESQDMNQVMAQLQQGYEGYDECVDNYRGTETVEEMQECWERHLGPLRKLYPHLVEPFQY